MVSVFCRAGQFQPYNPYSQQNGQTYSKQVVELATRFLACISLFRGH